MRTHAAAVALGALLLWASSCTPLESGSDTFDAAGRAGQQAGGNAAASGSGSGGSQSAGDGGAQGGQPDASNGAGQGPAAGAGPGQECPPPGEREVKVLGESGELTIDADTAWTCHYDYRVASNVIVAPGSTLAILAGTRIAMDEGTLLLSQRGARLEAEGTADEPIVFTSAVQVGQRAPGDFRGIVLIGNGPSHTASVPVYGTISGERAHFGGGQAGDPSGSCGSLRYVRIEFAGGSVNDESLPGAALTLAACGSGTVVDYVQVHRATDGVGLIGGTAALRHVLVSNNQLGDSIEWTGGYTGTMQFIVAQSLTASAAVKGGNSAGDAEASPVSRPTIYNATLAARPPLIPVPEQHYGLRLQLGSRAVFKNSVIVGFSDAAFHLDLPVGVRQNEVGPGKSIDISHVLMFDNVALYSPEAQVLDDVAVAPSMREQDPGLEAAANPTLDMPDAPPDFVPGDPTVQTQPAPIPAGFDATAGYRGGVPHDGADWTAGWTSYPQN